MTDRPEDPKAEAQSRRSLEIGADKWVAEAEATTERDASTRARLRRSWERLPVPARFASLLLLASVFPLLTSSDYYVRVGVNVIVFALLALGLNVVVGFAGLLDLGFVAFFGVGAYMYAILDSDKFGVHLPTLVTMILVVVGTALLGVFLGLSSWRLLGDYLAIVTLFFGQIFLVIVTNADRITPPWRDEPVDFTGGPNGIAGVDPMSFLSIEIESVTGYFYAALVLFAVVMTTLYLVSESRTGRAWRALREDPLAAELLGTPVNRLKLLAFMFGAATAGLAGTVFAAVQTGVFPQNFELPLLITVYTMVILGGAGSMSGVVVGAALITIVLEVLRGPADARLLFYGGVVLLVAAVERPWWRATAVLGGAVAFGVSVHEAVGALWTGGSGGTVVEGGSLADWIERWVLLPTDPLDIGNYAFVALVVAAIVVTRMRGWARTLALIPTLYLAAFVWENRLIVEPSVTRFLLLGVLLIVLMNARPQGLFGQQRVEIV
jgi:branched-chain amino acid transport system permease protein